MRKIYICILFLFTVLISGCNHKVQFEYSNLIDHESKEYLVNIFQTADLPLKNTTKFIDFVNEYNQTSYAKRLKSGFIFAYIGKPLYDYTNAIDCWTREHKESDTDINCRIAAFTLINSNIEMENENIEHINPSSSLLSELENKRVDWTYREKTKFLKIFNPIQINSDSNIVNSIKAKWRKEGITFSNQSQAKLICLCVQFSKDEDMKIAHTGIMFDRDDFLIFVEKTDPMMPFQMTKFKNRSELLIYLQGRLEEKPFRIIALENDSVITE